VLSMDCPTVSIWIPEGHKIEGNSSQHAPSVRLRKRRLVREGEVPP